MSSKQSNKQLNITTFNVKGIRSNLAYAHKILENSDFLLLQEHWIYNFEKEKLQDLFPGYKVFSKHVDDEIKLQHSFRPRGHGGIAIVYKEEIVPSVTQLPDGDCRVQAIKIAGKDKLPICLVNVYMPARGTVNGLDQYENSLAMLHEIIYKYYSTHNIIIAGDWNASFQRNYKDTQDSIFKKFCEEMGLQRSSNYPTGYTYNQGDQYSQIDYILQVMHGSEGDRTRISTPKIIND